VRRTHELPADTRASSPSRSGNVVVTLRCRRARSKKCPSNGHFFYARKFECNIVSARLTTDRERGVPQENAVLDRFRCEKKNVRKCQAMSRFCVRRGRESRESVTTDSLSQLDCHRRVARRASCRRYRRHQN
jgi:hypothetical protein